MRIHYLWGGKLPSELANSVHVMKMCEAMAALGHAVTLYHCSAPAGVATDAIFERYGIRHRFALDYIPSRSGWWRHLFGFQAALRARRAPAADLVFSRFLPAGAWTALLGLPTIQELHVPPATFSERVYLALLLRARGFRKLVVITQALKAQLQRVVPERHWADILVEADGVNLEEYASAAAQPVPADMAPFTAKRLLVGYIGSLHAGKGAELILPIARLVPQAQFVVVGGPDEIAAECRRAAAAAGVSNVAWLGFRPNAEVPRYVQACDVLLLPNQHRIMLLGRQDIGPWTSPLKMFEYMAAGKIIVASNLPVLAEVLNPGNAVLCEPGDPAAWAHEISGIVSGTLDYSGRARQARRDVERYGWQQRAARCLSAAGIGPP